MGLSTCPLWLGPPYPSSQACWLIPQADNPLLPISTRGKIEVKPEMSYEEPLDFLWQSPTLGTGDIGQVRLWEAIVNTVG